MVGLFSSVNNNSLFPEVPVEVLLEGLVEVPVDVPVS